MAGDSNNAYSPTSITKLTSKNYGFWVDKAQAILRNRGLWNLVIALLLLLPLTTVTNTETALTLPLSTKDVNDAKQLDAANALLLMILDKILGWLTIMEKSNKQLLWHCLIQMLRPAGLQQYIALQREYQALQHDPDTETLDEFLDREKTIQDEMLATGVTVSDDLRLVIFLMSSMPNKYATTIQL
jgi:hypothetical protein